MKVELTKKETKLISSETIKELTNSLNCSCQTDLSMDFLKQEWQDSINPLKHSFTAFLEHKSTSDHQSWVNLEGQRKLKENFSSSWKMQKDFQRSIQRFQLAIDEAKVRLDLAISPGTWLMPSNLALNTQSTVGYNNNLKKATGNMKLGVNSDVNLDLEKVGVRMMDGGPSKNNRPTSHPSNPIENENKKTKPLPLDSSTVTKKLQESNESEKKEESNHETLKSGLIIAASLGAFAILRFFR